MRWTEVSECPSRCARIDVRSIVAGEEVKGKAKQMKDGVGEAATAAKDKLHEEADHVKDGAEKSLSDEFASDG